MLAQRRARTRTPADAPDGETWLGGAPAEDGAERARPRLADEQLHVAELVPAVARSGRGVRRAGEDAAAGDRLEQVEVRGARVVEAREDAVDGADRALRADDEVGPAGGGADGAVRAGGRLQGADDRRADRDRRARGPRRPGPRWRRARGSAPG